MKKIIFYLLSVFTLIIGKTTTAQQSSLFNTYSLDPLQLNIAYAGAGCTEANIHYRTQWIGMKESPKVLQLNAHTALGKSNGLALRVNSQTQGLLNTMQATIGYAYRFSINQTTRIHLGIGVGWSQAALNSQKAVVMDANDASLSTNRQTANGFDSEFGAMLVGDKMKAGVSVLHLYNTNPSFAGSSYKTLPQFNTQISYTFNKGKKVEIEPWLLDRYTLKGDNVVEGILNFNFLKTITVGAGYRTNYGVIALVGAKIANIKLAYSFDYGASKNAVNLGSSHQVMLGFTLCKAHKPVKPAEEPVAKTTPTPEVLPVVEAINEEPVKEQVAVKEEPKKEEPKKEEVKEDILAKMNIIADGVIFELNKSKLGEEGLKKLQEIAALMKKDPELKINIVGHTCNKGTDEVNSLLSIRRATYVRNELVKYGADPQKIDRSKGVGSENAIYDNNSELQSKNRTIRFEHSK
ncbi:MAG: PorP/SprF family type IX secretion system membrane protein [Bacteroidota bacterium]